jgi:predicted RNase H-like nuclease
MAMSKPSEQVWLAGVDGCPGGRWIATFVQPSGEQGEARVFSQFACILAAREKPSIIAVDVPIGLPACGGRAAETAVRPLLGNLKRSVFPIPSRRAIFAETGPFANQKARYAAHQRACAIAAAASKPAKRITMQAFGIFPKIREVDAVMRSNASLKERIYETHPELAFRQLNGRPLDQPKKVNGRPYAPGLALRRRLLTDAGFPAAIVEAAPPHGTGPDDLLDALACAFVARHIAAGFARPFPDPPERDQFDLPMAIWA